MINKLISKIFIETAKVTGKEFLEEVVKILSKELDLPYIFISIISDKKSSKYAQTLVAHFNGNIIESFEYEFKGTPCEKVLEKGFYFHESNICSAFPDDIYLQEIKAEGYIGKIFFDSNNIPIGLFSFISTKKLAEVDFYSEILEIITPRISTELDRLTLEYKLEEKRKEYINSISLVSLERHKYKLFFNSNPQPMWVYDIETLRFISVNNSAIQHYGYSEEDFLSMTIKDIRPKEDINKLVENISNITTGIDNAGQWRHIKKNGELIFVEITSYVIEVDNRKCELVLVNDITNTKITESKIIEINNLMNNVIGNIDASFFALDKNYNYISFNKRHAKGMLEIYGSNIELGKPLFDYQTNPIDVEKAKINIDKALNGESFTASDYSGNENFSRPIFEISHNPIIDHNGQVIGVSLFAWDITEKRKREDELREISQRLLIATKASGVGVWEYDFTKDKFIGDDNIKKIYDIPPNKITTLEDWFKIVNKEDIPKLKSELFSNKDNFEYEFRLAGSNNKTKVIQGYAIVERDNKGRNTKLIGTNKDITEIKRYQELLEKTLREKEILLKEVHHRVKNNFQIIISMLNLQKSKIKNPEALESIMDAKRRVRGIALIHQKIYQSEDLATINFDNYISTIVNELNKTHKNILSVPVKIDLELEHVILDVDHAIPCGLIINEVITNSFKYAFPNEFIGEAHIGISLKNLPKDRVAIAIYDNGIGFVNQVNIEDSIGLKLISNLFMQLQATYEFISDNGVIWKFIFKKN